MLLILVNGLRQYIVVLVLLQALRSGVGPQELDRHDPVEGLLTCQVDATHRPSTEPLLQAVAASEEVAHPRVVWRDGQGHSSAEGTSPSLGDDNQGAGCCAS